ncbi:MAG: Hpt domain-containing protein [Lawsonibacter sp.]|jgi:HPt (histidine-containing phosphotransfer) domain-containing protein
MEPTKKICLCAAGIDVDDALERLMGSEALLERFLKKFLEDSNYQTLCAAIREEDWDKSLSASHALKGLSGNLSMTELYRLFTQQVTQLRAGDYAEAQAMMGEITENYERVAQAIRGCYP